MFLTYINELAVIPERNSIKVKLFADDIKLYLHVHVVQLQNTADVLVSWAAERQLSISVNKCCVLNVGMLADPVIVFL